MDSKLPDTGTTIFAVMSALSEECNAINLSQGFPSFDPDQELLDLVSKYINNGANQYAPMLGVASLRQAIAGKVEMLYGRSIDADTEVTVCDGATEGLFSAIQATVRPGDEVIVFDPAYDSYERCDSFHFSYASSRVSPSKTQFNSYVIRSMFSRVP